MVSNAVELAAAVDELLEHPDRAARSGDQGRKIVQQNRGALDRLLVLFDPLIDSVGQ
jgi:3-deoxy-D-manno-octulosonic-acid transferase